MRHVASTPGDSKPAYTISTAEVPVFHNCSDPLLRPRQSVATGSSEFGVGHTGMDE